MNAGVKQEEEATPAAGPDRYRVVLDKELGVSLDELLSWYEEEVTKTRNEFIETAARLNLPGETVRTPIDAANIMNKYAVPADSPEEMFDRLRKYRLYQGNCRWVTMRKTAGPRIRKLRETYLGGYGAAPGGYHGCVFSTTPTSAP